LVTAGFEPGTYSAASQLAPDADTEPAENASDKSLLDATMAVESHCRPRTTVHQIGVRYTTGAALVL